MRTPPSTGSRTRTARCPAGRHRGLARPEGQFSLVWGTTDPELVLVHGGAQNAHTWDTVALALGRPLIAIDLPGHGHSDGGPGGSLSVRTNGEDLAAVIRQLAPNAVGVVGMSLGGLSSIALTAAAPDLVRVPRPHRCDARHLQGSRLPHHQLHQRPRELPQLRRAAWPAPWSTIPSRSESSLRRGILHNALQREDGSWVWRYARFRSAETATPPDFGSLWDDVSDIKVPLLLVRGLAWSVVEDGESRRAATGANPTPR